MENDDINSSKTPILAGISRENPFSVPPNYFDELPENIQILVKNRPVDLPTMSTPFLVPDGYFENLSTRIMTQIENKELNELPQQTPFSVPKGYFDELPSKINQRIYSKPTILQIGLVQKIFRIQTLIPAIAACFALLVMIKFAKPIFSDDKIAMALTIEEITNSSYLHDIDETLLIQSLNTNKNFKKSFKNTSIKDIENYLLDNNIDDSELSLHL